MNEIKCTKVRFYSHRDEAAFFAFAEGIPAVRKIVGDADSIVLVLRPKVSENSLRELIALLLRYKVDMRALAALENEKNSSWFRDPGAFWYKKVFSSPDRKKTRNQTAPTPSVSQ